MHVGTKSLKLTVDRGENVAWDVMYEKRIKK